ncbi:hypothetical protein A3B19_00280 [Candidatus Giovannonibacteria bacterium RIFCSPLOWO2_01_FULL_46_32]|uniref:Uncharacterized protein n=1 Tax=Candidatus Giovannonibacteria bacterium RIFCSPLOWO2_01_FULL_46_32 TaxID=1798353 RepID=A0A1F5XFG0_9BACT|nr:MAG: hypothetical protein A3B19_00280 [Candidatus Giovannonibacteria bacterium RIFCSPLOWO2_01_FULL_46_32]
MVVQLTEKRLKTLVRESVEEALDSKLMRLSSILLPKVSRKEQKEIERLYKNPAHKTARSYFIKV